MTIKKTNVKAKQEKPKPAEQAKMLNSPSIMSAATSDAFAKSMFPDLELSELISELSSKIESVESGDMSSMEAMLVGQASALQTIFTSLARKASNQEYLKNYGMFMTLALKAQSQSKSTIQALIELKYPKQIAFVKQANIANGHQQVNNGVATQTTTSRLNALRAKYNQNQPNELLEENNGSPKMDIGTKTKASRADKAMATMEK